MTKHFYKIVINTVGDQTYRVNMTKVTNSYKVRSLNCE